MNPTNCYLILRHGESSTNSKNIIVCLPENGIQHYGLTGTGNATVSHLTQTHHAIDEITNIFASDFKRTIETTYMIENNFLFPYQ
jgi:bisphosphoglycerate-dependent phosphoglycerate mutase